MPLVTYERVSTEVWVDHSHDRSASFEQGEALYPLPIDLADIGAPDAAYTRICFEPGPIFARQDILRID